MASPQALADLGLVEVESPQEAAALQSAHGLLGQAQPLSDRPGVDDRHEACRAGALAADRRCVRSQAMRKRLPLRPSTAAEASVSSERHSCLSAA